MHKASLKCNNLQGLQNNNKNKSFTTIFYCSIQKLELKRLYFHCSKTFVIWEFVAPFVLSSLKLFSCLLIVPALLSDPFHPPHVSSLPGCQDFLSLWFLRYILYFIKLHLGLRLSDTLHHIWLHESLQLNHSNWFDHRWLSPKLSITSYQQKEFSQLSWWWFS